MKISSYDPKYTSFEDLECGDVFYCTEEDDICMKLDDYEMAVILRNGSMVDVKNDTMILPIANARLVFD
jgi:hypothetical protein